MNHSNRELSRIEETLGMIPSDVVSLLEVGCGDGRVTNSICFKRKVAGIDIDKERVKLFQGIKIVADVSKLPFKDSTFDLILCAEILEHLPENIFLEALCEINRVFKKYILVTVPYNETLSAQWAKCSKCTHTFHAWGHLRKFAIGELRKLFPLARLKENRFFTPKEVKVPALSYIIARKVGNTWQHDQGGSIRCPNCGGKPLNSAGNILGYCLMRIIWRFQTISLFKKPIWIGCLYTRILSE